MGRMIDEAPSRPLRMATKCLSVSTSLRPDVLLVGVGFHRYWGPLLDAEAHCFQEAHNRDKRIGYVHKNKVFSDGRHLEDAEANRFQNVL